jgi:hypothetical protein
LHQRIQPGAPREDVEPYKAQTHYYGDKFYWRRANIFMRVVLLIFLVLCLT